MHEFVCVGEEGEDRNGKLAIKASLQNPFTTEDTEDHREKSKSPLPVKPARNGAPTDFQRIVPVGLREVGQESRVLVASVLGMTTALFRSSSRLLRSRFPNSSLPGP